MHIYAHIYFHTHEYIYTNLQICKCTGAELITNIHITKYGNTGTYINKCAIIQVYTDSNIQDEKYTNIQIQK